MKRLRRIVSIVCISLSMALVSNAPLLAQPREPAEERVPPVDRSETIAARAELTRARLALLRAEASVNNVTETIEAELRSSEPYQRAIYDVNVARARYESIRQPILRALLFDEEYAGLNDTVESARMTLRRLAEEERATFLEMLPHAKRALEAGRKMSRAEVIALAIDPAVEEARTQMVAAYNRLRSMTAGFRREASESVNARLAMQDLESARARVRAATIALSDALKREADAEALRDSRIRGVENGGELNQPDRTDRPRRTGS